MNGCEFGGGGEKKEVRERGKDVRYIKKERDTCVCMCMFLNETIKYY